MEIHAKQYSYAYKKGYGSSFWLKDFDMMANKTMLRQLISKWGMMSIELQNAIETDSKVITTTENGAFSSKTIDNEYLEENNEKEIIEDAVSEDDVIEKEVIVSDNKDVMPGQLNMDDLI